jgi:tRNA (guanine37-N1)-methyltransferase
MRFDVVTIFPDALDSMLKAGLVGKAISEGKLEVAIHDLRRWAPPPHRKVDDTPFGGGPGMVMTAGPIVEAVEELREARARVAILSAAGRPFTQQTASELVAERQVILECGRYEGIDDRARQVLGADELSIGPYVLSGGEPAAAVIIDAVGRLVEGVLGNAESVAEESFVDPLLEYPHFTRPQSFRGLAVPDVLLSGNHGQIATWRREQALRRTFESRPELLNDLDISDEERMKIEDWRRQAD